MAESHKHYEQKKPDIKDHITYDSMMFEAKVNLWR